jgi:hypothetical protein
MRKGIILYSLMVLAKASPKSPYLLRIAVKTKAAHVAID